MFIDGIVRLFRGLPSAISRIARRIREVIAVSHTSTVEYGRKLIHAGVNGVRSGHTEFDPDKAHALVTRSAEEAARMAFAGACLGVVPGCLLARRSRTSTALLFGVAGSVLGFVVAFSWKTRSLSSTLAHSAMKEISRVQDDHWLERNPIDYA